MTTVNHRVMVPLTPHLHELLVRVAAMEGQTVGRLIATLLAQTEPLLAKLVEAADAFQNFKSQNKEVLVAALTTAEDDLGAVLRASDALQGVSAGVLTRLAQAPLGASCAPRGLPEHASPQGGVGGSEGDSLELVQPPYSNTGVITHKSLKTLKPKKGKNSPKKGGARHAV